MVEIGYAKDKSFIVSSWMVTGNAILPDNALEKIAGNSELIKTLFRGLYEDVFILTKETYQVFIDFWGLCLDDDDRATIKKCFE